MTLLGRIRSVSLLCSHCSRYLPLLWHLTPNFYFRFLLTYSSQHLIAAMDRQMHSQIQSLTYANTNFPTRQSHI